MGWGAQPWCGVPVMVWGLCQSLQEAPQGWGLQGLVSLYHFPSQSLSPSLSPTGPQPCGCSPPAAPQPPDLSDPSGIQAQGSGLRSAPCPPLPGAVRAVIKLIETEPLILVAGRPVSPPGGKRCLCPATSRGGTCSWPLVQGVRGHPAEPQPPAPPLCGEELDNPPPATNTSNPQPASPVQARAFAAAPGPLTLPVRGHRRCRGCPPSMAQLRA